MGGYPPSTCSFGVVRDVAILDEFEHGNIPGAELAEDIEYFSIKQSGVRIRAGGKDAFVYTLGGGAGVGDPLLRSPELVARDVRDGYVTEAQAESAYGVVVNADQEVDADATRTRRREVRAERLGSEPKNIDFGERADRSVQPFPEQVGDEVACGCCGERFAPESCKVRRREAAEALAGYGATALSRGQDPIVLEERFCPACGTSIDVTTARATDGS
jgi:N-methylhydantoinase B